MTEYKVMGEDKQVIVIKEKSSGFSAMKLMGVLFFLCALPFLCLLIIPVGIITAIGTFVATVCAVQNYGMWVLAAILGIPVILALKDRVSGTKTIRALTKQVARLESELADARHAILLLEEEKEFERRLEQGTPSSVKSQD